MKALIALGALLALSACNMPSTAQEAVERKDDVWGPTEVCYDGITYLYVTVHGGYALTLKIDSETLQPIRCKND